MSKDQRPRVLWEFSFVWRDELHTVRIVDSSTAEEWANTVGFVAFVILTAWFIL